MKVAIVVSNYVLLRAVKPGVFFRCAFILSRETLRYLNRGLRGAFLVLAGFLLGGPTFIKLLQMISLTWAG